jgi:hypothetical protein
MTPVPEPTSSSFVPVVTPWRLSTSPRYHRPVPNDIAPVIQS